MCSEEIPESGCDCKGAFVFLQFVFNFVKMPFFGGSNVCSCVTEHNLEV